VLLPPLVLRDEFPLVVSPELVSDELPLPVGEVSEPTLLLPVIPCVGPVAGLARVPFGVSPAPEELPLGETLLVEPVFEEVLLMVPPESEEAPTVPPAVELLEVELLEEAALGLTAALWPTLMMISPNCSGVVNWPSVSIGNSKARP
jgi:hypothetical protein